MTIAKSAFWLLLVATVFVSLDSKPASASCGSQMVYLYVKCESCFGTVYVPACRGTSGHGCSDWATNTRCGVGSTCYVGEAGGCRLAELDTSRAEVAVASPILRRDHHRPRFSRCATKGGESLDEWLTRKLVKEDSHSRAGSVVS
jgi:hypothetical protein